MIPIIKTFLSELLWSPERARLWARGFLAWAAAVAAQLVTSTPEQILAWTARQWAVHLAVAGLAGLAVMVKAGEQNPKPLLPGQL